MEAGYYWVRVRRLSEWIVGHYNGKTWQIVGSEAEYRDVAEIGPYLGQGPYE